MSETRYTLAPGLEIVPLGESSFKLRSDFAAVKLSGEAAVDLVERVLSGLHRPLAFDEIAERMPGYSPESLREQVETLLREGILVPAGEENADNPPLLALLEEMGLSAAATAQRLAQCRVSVFGLEAHGAHVARLLAEVGVGRLVLVDPFPFESAHFTLTPVVDPGAAGRSRQDAVAGLLSRFPAVGTAGDAPLDAARVSELVADSDLAVVCWDRGFAAAHHWANRSCLEHGVPGLFSELGSTRSIAGPFFLPLRSACWMCYRMRNLACEPDFDLAISYEEHLDRKKQPTLAQRPVFPALPGQLGSVLGLEAFKYLIRLHQPMLVDRVLEFDAFSAVAQAHPVLVKPDCPVCSKKKARLHPERDALLKERSTSSHLPELVDRLVSPLTGIVSQLTAAHRDPSEPPRPYVWRARLANHRFLSQQDDTHVSCSGKGMTREKAWTSCLGEAVERYSGGCWDEDEVVIARRPDLEGPSLDPSELVLYLPEQYCELPYAPYDDATEMAWIRGRSLIRGDSVLIPAIAVFMEYAVRSAAEFIAPITSNGLAAGPSLCAAVLGAVYEVLERDAFLIAWLQRLPGRSFEAADHPDPEVRELALAYRRRGARLALVELPTDHPVSVFVGLVLQEGGVRGPSATVGLGASLDPVEAARSAAFEAAQVRPAIRRRARGEKAERVAELAADPAAVKTMEDHALLYAHPSTAGAFDFLFGESAAWTPGQPAGPDVALGRLLDHFAAVGQEVLYVNLTPPEIEPFGLHTARAVLPGYQPIWFGRHERRLAGRRLYDLPCRLGLRDTPAGVESLNPLPHPLA